MKENNLVMAEGSEMESVKEEADTGCDSSGKGRKRCNSNPAAEELGIDFEGEKPKKKMKNANDNGDDRSFLDCNICLETATEPVVTCCGHLFCWACFFKVRCIDSISETRECPVCRGEVADSAIVPIYGGNGGSIEELEPPENGGSGAVDIIPPRPKGNRTERVLNQTTTFPVAVDGQLLLASPLPLPRVAEGGFGPLNGIWNWGWVENYVQSLLNSDSQDLLFEAFDILG
ncbi:hypothetical protein M9H77_11118 [Catharanthus roseus]|uniref:Uncharacterized protein n=1 Tax=Catharanthus roseus TaxID=4058 RepID=A0ACC0BDM2_CATRO|nr:hypothetical protein M9H77_11118 [Catharanthus roseus]